MRDIDTSLAVCAQTAPDLFFPENLSEAMTNTTKQTVQLCFTCPLIEACFEDAMKQTHEADWGIWGGSNKYERARMKRNPKLLMEHRRKIKEATHAITNTAKGEAA